MPVLGSRRTPRCPRQDCKPIDEQPLLAAGQVLVGQVEGGSDRQVLRVHQLKPVASRREVVRQASKRPSWMMVQLPGQHANC